jgi:hypothetical protein
MLASLRVRRATMAGISICRVPPASLPTIHQHLWPSPLTEATTPGYNAFLSLHLSVFGLSGFGKLNRAVQRGSSGFVQRVNGNGVSTSLALKGYWAGRHRAFGSTEVGLTPTGPPALVCTVHTSTIGRG